MPGQRKSRAEWERLSAEVERTGSLERVADRHRVSRKRLAWWRWRLSREQAAGDVDGRVGGRSSQRILPIAIEPDAVAPSMIEIRVAQVSLCVVPGTPTAYVAELVEALRRC